MSKQKTKCIPENIGLFISYDCKTGNLYHTKKTSNFDRTDFGDKIIAKGSSGYIHLKFKGSHYLAHRVAWFLHYREQPPRVVDHIDRDKSNNRICNLRGLSFSDNRRNTVYFDTNKFVGVTRTKTGKFKASIRVYDKMFYIGTFNCEFMAAMAFDMVFRGQAFNRKTSEIVKYKLKRSEND